MLKFAFFERRGFRQPLRCRRGVTALEFALIAPLLFVLLFFTMDLARYWYTAEAVRTYAAEVLRAAVVTAGADNPPVVNACATPMAVSTPITPGLDPSSMQLTVRCSRNTSTQGYVVSRTVSVTASYTFHFAVGVGLFWAENQLLSDTQTTTF